MIRPATLDHAFLDQLDPVWPDGLRYVRQAIDLKMTELSWAYQDEEGPVWAWGLVPCWNGVGEVWMAFDKRASRHIFQIVRHARDKLRRVERVYGYRRLQGQWHVDCPCAKLAKMMGFEQEGILRQAGLHGEGDYIMASRIS